MMTLVASCTVAYLALALAAVFFVRRTQLVQSEGALLPFVSVLVAARNEADALPECIESLLQQDYPTGRYEIIVIDDHSTDGTSEIASAYPVRCIPVRDERLSGKAGALHEGVLSAGGELIAVTDADCRPPRQWLRRLSDQLSDSGCGIVCGVTTVADGSPAARIQGMDWLLLLGVAAGLSEMGLPVTAMGNNMCFRREAYNAVGGYPRLPASVTEDYALFRAIHRQTPFDARLLLHKDVRNVTLPATTWKEVIRQRKRWLRGGLRAGLATYLIYFVAFLAHLGPVVLLVPAPLLGIGLLLLKWASDAFVIHAATEKIGVRSSWRSFPAFELYLTSYVAVLPLVLALSPGVVWKGRRH